MESGSVIAGSSTASGRALPTLRPRLEKFGRYYLLDRIAVGGMAEVYRAVTHGVEGFRRTFVVKRILAKNASTPAFIRMFCDEARISALLHHPNIVQVYDFGHVNGSYFLAMEYLLGKDLSSLMRVLRAAKAAVPPALAAFIAREAALGLHHAHALRGSSGQPLGIVHRDVTPSNLMLLYAGGVKVLDFGIAKVSTEAAEAESGVKGKFGYLAPEQARGAEVDGRADVFALGVTLWEMLVGRRLFAGKNDFETLRNVLQRPVPPPSALRPDAGIPPALDRLVLRALERSVERRHDSAAALARDLDGVLAEARADGQTLRAFLDDLFAEESSSLSLDAPEIPEELFAAAVSAPVVAPARDGVPREDQSLEIEVIEPSVPGRVRNAAPPFGVIAADGTSLGVGGRRLRWSRSARWAAGAVLGAALLVGLGLAAQTRSAPPSSPVVAAPPRIAPPTRPPVAAPAPPPPPVEAPADVAAAAAVSAPATKVHRGHARARDLSADLTINPF